MNYFDKIPTITYNGSLCKNLLARAQLSSQTREQQSVFYPYTMENADRVDLISNDYYDQPGYTWLIWMTNNTIDPYYDLPLVEDDFIQYIIKKYGSYQSAARRVYFYRNNWYDYTDQRLNVQEFNVIAANYKKYYEPILDNNLNVAAYKRKRHDDTVSTNKIVTMTLTGRTGNFVVDEEVRVDINNYGYVTYVEGNTITIKHIYGSLDATDTISGMTSGTTATIQTETLIDSTIAFTDATYWSPVTYLEFEQEANERKKTIQLLDPRYVGQAESDLKRVMSVR